MAGISEKTISGIRWSMATQMVRFLLHFAISVILARILSPRDFGLAGMIIIFSAFADQISELGLSTAVIHNQQVTQNQLSVIFWLNLITGLLLTVLFILCSPILADFYNESALRQYTPVWALVFLINAFSIVPRALIYKEIRFKLIAIAESSAVLVSGATAILLALKGCGVWSLVFQSILRALIIAILLLAFSRWRPRFYFGFGEMRDFIHVAAHRFGFNVLDYWQRNFDNLLIAKYIGSSALGVYSRAYSLMLLPINQISLVLSRVMFPSFATIQSDKPRIKDIYMKACRMIALVSFPMMIGLFVTVRPFILTVYGDKWEAVIPVFRILCVVAVGQSISATMGWIFNSLGRTDILFRLALYQTVAYFGAFVVGLRWGIEGVALAYLIIDYLIWFPSWIVTGRLINMSLAEVHKNLLAPFACAVTMGFFVWLIGLWAARHMQYSLCLASQTVCGVLIYWVLIRSFNLRAYGEAKRILFRS